MSTTRKGRQTNTRFTAGDGSALTARTGILELRLSARGVEASRLRPAVIRGTRPELVGR